MKTAIWWIRRDLRLRSNRALAECVEHGGAVVPLFILDPVILKSRTHGKAGRRQAFLFGGLHSLERSLREKGSRLIIRSGLPAKVLSEVVLETGADLVCAEEDFSPYARRRDAEVKGMLPLRLVPGLTVHDPREVVKPDGNPYSVFGAFKRNWTARLRPAESVSVPLHLRAPGNVGSHSLPRTTTPEHFPPGEEEGRRRLLRFLRGQVLEYSTARNRLDLYGTSLLSPYFRFGMVSVCDAVEMIRKTAESGEAPGAAAWLGELVWREFYISVLFHYPHVLRSAFRPEFRDISWRQDRPALNAWQQGETGYPIVDAGMRQLLASGWMHNRARMITASFLVKDLLIDWHEGERWFIHHLVDGDPAANNGGWQWAAGTGTDAAPYFRVFNPVVQGERYDPAGNYVRRWVPELAGLSEKWIHKPWEAPSDVLRSAGVALGRTYPRPIVDHSEARKRALKTFTGIRRR
jgi:deoxyribodipyrimidine photo-lyase